MTEHFLYIFHSSPYPAGISADTIGSSGAEKPQNRIRRKPLPDYTSDLVHPLFPKTSYFFTFGNSIRQPLSSIADPSDFSNNFAVV